MTVSDAGTTVLLCRSGGCCSVRFSTVSSTIICVAGATDSLLIVPHRLPVRTRDLPYTAIESILRERQLLFPPGGYASFDEARVAALPEENTSNSRGRGECDIRGGGRGISSSRGSGLQRWGWTYRQRMICRGFLYECCVSVLV